MDKPLWGLRVLKFDGTIAPRVLRFDAPPARGLLWAPYIYRRRPLMIKPSQPGFRPWENHTTALRARKCIPPLVAGATTFPPRSGGTITRAYCRAAYEESASRCFILPPKQGEVRRSRKGGGERSEPIRRMLFMPYDIESQSRNADFISIAAERQSTTFGPKGRQT